MRRALTVAALALAVLAMGGALTAHLAARALRGEVIRLLGPTGHAERIDVGFSRITLDQVVIGAPAGWPAPYALRAQRVVLEPALWELLSHRVAIRRAVLDGAYLSIVRSREHGIALLPGMRAASDNPTNTAQATHPEETAGNANVRNGARTASATPYKVDIGNIVFHNGALDFFDGVVSQPAARVRIDALDATLGPLHFPELANATQIALAARIVGPQQSGPVRIDGWIAFHDQRSDLAMRFSQVDVQALRPYIQKGRAAFIQSGLVGVDVHSLVQSHQLHADGRVTLTHLQLAPATGPLAALTTLPRDAALAALQDRQGRIAFDFSLQGDLSDPTFSLEGDLSTRLAAGIAKALGVGAEGIARGVGDTSRGLGGALRELLGK
ncbi:DUF748 domain-containing protein [Robbsia sp. Bb-Pol-6]|uniref:DUF748 domain-containing protein n=1 Tax=Robbsia betulipollinis TaxID=2981849 RepID=A0ABT3ZNU9_9BURK|nr:DUF748 domain-containing protein [Robbsia betulipollinis]MCY0388224.1 DUF748 domain-containing protein [Robbsia betulipollinis]